MAIKLCWKILSKLPPQLHLPALQNRLRRQPRQQELLLSLLLNRQLSLQHLALNSLRHLPNRQPLRLLRHQAIALFLLAHPSVMANAALSCPLERL